MAASRITGRSAGWRDSHFYVVHPPDASGCFSPPRHGIVAQPGNKDLTFARCEMVETPLNPSNGTAPVRTRGGVFSAATRAAGAGFVCFWHAVRIIASAKTKPMPQ